MNQGTAPSLDYTTSTCLKAAQDELEVPHFESDL